MSGIPRRVSFVSCVSLLLVLSVAALSSEDFTEESAKAHEHSAHEHNGSKNSLVPSEVEGTLRTEVDSDLRFSGIFRGSGSSVGMHSKQAGVDGKISPRTPKSAFMVSSASEPKPVTTADSIEASLAVNGKRIDVSEDLNGGTVRLDPHGQVLTEADLTAINGAYYDFEGRLAPLFERAGENNVDPEDSNPYDEHPRLDPANPLNPQDDLLLRAFIFLSEAPVGVPLEDQVASQPALGEFKIETAQEAASRATSADANASEEIQSAGLASAVCEDRENSLALELVACRNPNDNDNYIHTCGTVSRTTQHDDGKHCFRTFRKVSGPNTTGCWGRCGKGCGRKNGLGIYTLDCLDHDHVVGHVGYAAPRAQDEFRWTWDDAAYGENNPGRKCRR